MAFALFLAGFFSTLAAIVFGYTAATMATAVQVPYTGYPGGVANLELMHIQAMTNDLSIGFGIVAAILIAAGAVVRSIQSRDA